MGTEVNFRLLRSPSNVYQGKCPCDHVQCSCSVYFQVCELDSESRRRRRGKCMKWKSLYSALSLSHSLGRSVYTVGKSGGALRMKASRPCGRRKEGERDTSDTALPSSSSRPDRPTDRPIAMERGSNCLAVLRPQARRSVGRSSLDRQEGERLHSNSSSIHSLHVRRASTRRSIREGGY